MKLILINIKQSIVNKARHITAATRCAPPFGAVLGTRAVVFGKRSHRASANSVAYAPLLRAAATLCAIKGRPKTLRILRLHECKRKYSAYKSLSG